MTDFERIITSAPVNSQAARQMGKGEHFVPRVKMTDAMYDVPPEMRPVPEGSHDFTGVKYDRIVVVGMREKVKRQHGKALWVCRCICGTYIERTARAIAKKAGGECANCGYTRKLREGLLPGMKNFGKGEA